MARLAEIWIILVGMSVAVKTAVRRFRRSDFINMSVPDVCLKMARNCLTEVNAITKGAHPPTALMYFVNES